MSDDGVKNLLEETIQELKASSLTLQDVRWWGTVVASYPLEDLERALNVVYDSGYGSSAAVVDGLRLVGDDWWLERHEYHGMEWWEFKTLPPKPEIEVATPRIVEE
jgi:hypothetical protein